MADIILSHSVLGLRPIERHLAERLRARGHAVALPDLYQGAATDDLDEGFAIKARIGWGAICLKAREALAPVPGDAVPAGISIGAGVVAEFWASRPLAAGVPLLHGLATVPHDPACPSDCMSRHRSTVPRARRQRLAGKRGGSKSGCAGFPLSKHGTLFFRPGIARLQCNGGRAALEPLLGVPDVEGLRTEESKFRGFRQVAVLAVISMLHKWLTLG